MTLRTSRDPAIQAYGHEEWVRVIAKDVKGQDTWLYNGYARPAFAYRQIDTIVELRDVFDRAKSLVTLVCLRGQEVGKIRLNETPEEIENFFRQENLPVPKVIAFEI